MDDVKFSYNGAKTTRMFLQVHQMAPPGAKLLSTIAGYCIEHITVCSLLNCDRTAAEDASLRRINVNIQHLDSASSATHGLVAPSDGRETKQTPEPRRNKVSFESISNSLGAEITFV